MSTARWHILGAGSVGTLLAYHLRAARQPVTLLLRNPPRKTDQASVGTDDGKIALKITSLVDTSKKERDGSPLEVDYDVVSAPSSNLAKAKPDSTIERLLITTKTVDCLEAFSSVRKRMRPETVVVLLVNGWGSYEEILQTFYPPLAPASSSSSSSSSRPSSSSSVTPTEPPFFILGSTSHGCYRESPFHVVHAGSGTFRFGRPSVPVPDVAVVSTLDSERRATILKRVFADLSAALASLDVVAPVEPPERLRDLLLVKLAVNCCINPLTALFKIRNGELAAEGSPQAFLARLMAAEIVSAIRGYIISAKDSSEDGDLPDALSSRDALLAEVHVVCTRTARNFSSMYQDIHSTAGVTSTVNKKLGCGHESQFSAFRRPRRRRRTEIDHILGKVIEMGREEGLWMVWCRIVYSAVKLVERIPR